MNTNVGSSPKPPSTPTSATPPVSMPSSAPISTPPPQTQQESPASIPTPKPPQATTPPATTNPSEGFVFSGKNKLQEVHLDQENHVNVNGNPMPIPAQINQSSQHNSSLPDSQNTTTTVR